MCLFPLTVFSVESLALSSFLFIFAAANGFNTVMPE
jgi:hypothetical protein